MWKKIPAQVQIVDPSGEKHSLPAEWIVGCVGDGSALEAGVPNWVILSTADILRDFQEDTGQQLVERDVQNIVFHVVQALLLDDTADLEYMDKVPDFNGMQTSAIFKSHDFSLQVKAATQALAQKLHQRLQENDLYRKGEFPYFFSRFIPSGDMLLQRLP